MKPGLLRTVVVTVVSTAAGFVLLDAVAWAGNLIDVDIHVTATDRFAATIVTVALALVIEQANHVRDELENQRIELQRMLAGVMNQQFSASLNSQLTTLGILTAAKGKTNRYVSDVAEAVSLVVQPIVDLPDPLRSGVAAWIHEPLAGQREKLTQLQRDGVEVSVGTHLRVTRAIVEAGTREYLQINRRLYDPEQEWTAEWRDFVEWLGGSPNCSGTYIVLVETTVLADDANRAKLDRMGSFFRSNGWDFRVCDVPTVVDTVGQIATEANLEFFDSSLIKVQGLPVGGYKGGAKLSMVLTTASDRRALGELGSAVISRSTAHVPRVGRWKRRGRP